MIPLCVLHAVLGLLSAASAAGNLTPSQEGQGAPRVPLANGDMEALDAEGRLTGWRTPQSLLEAGYEIGPESDDVFAGVHAARIDSRAVAPSDNSFGNLMQSVDAKPWRGMRVRFRAAVKVPEGEPGGRAQMWLRVDLAAAGGAPRMGFFDNMDDRPIESDSWATYEIVGDVAEDAQTIVLGVLTLGQCLVLVDEATLEVVKAEVASTARPQADAPTQPFFSAWLFLPLIAFALFALGFLARGRTGKFAFAFTFLYWALYAFPTLLSSLVPFVGARWSAALEAGPIDALVRWAAPHLLGIEGELVSAIRNGSGDSTYSYVQAFLTFALALLLAALWFVVDRRATDHMRLKDLLRSGLRYTLAIYMVGYGIAKLGSLTNQFPAPGLWRLAQPYGESSPMGLLWTLMGSSRAYTAFGGGMELFGGVLLLWRRTTLLGALVSAGVLCNVVLMNFCYDVPVKLFSTHLVVAALCIALPETSRLLRFFLGLGPGTPSGLAFPFTSRAATWTHRGLKAAFVIMVLGLPLYSLWSSERSSAAGRPALGEWKLASLELDGQAAAPSPGEVEYLTLPRRFTSIEGGWTLPCTATLIGGSQTSASATLTPQRLSFDGNSGGTSLILPGEFRWSVADGVLHLESPEVRATFAPAANDYLLMRRGFRWINERPFNR